MSASSLLVLKVGGDIATNPILMTQVSKEIAVLKEFDFDVVLVHGGGPQLDQALKENGRQSRRIAGRRITSKKDLELAIQVWRGTLSVSWIKSLSHQGVMACGICGADGLLLSGHRRPPKDVIDDNGSMVKVDFGYVGDLEHVNADLLHALLASNIVPVISPLAFDPVSGQILNVNADTVAAKVAAELNSDCLIILASIPGLLLDVDDPMSKVSNLALKDVPDMIENGIIAGGMRPKVEAIGNALEEGVGRAIILDGRSRDIVNFLVYGIEVGTEISIEIKPQSELASKTLA
ncbi:MAG: acetylglutamate kinase [Myxococcota bacterium]